MKKLASTLIGMVACISLLGASSPSPVTTLLPLAIYKVTKGNHYVRVGTVVREVSASNAWTPYFANAIKTTVILSAVAGKFGGASLVNIDSAPVYLQVFDTTGAVTLGTTVPNFVIPYPSNATAANGIADRWEMASGINIVNGIKCAATTTPSGASTSTNGLSGTILYR